MFLFEPSDMLLQSLGFSLPPYGRSELRPDVMREHNIVLHNSQAAKNPRAKLPTYTSNCYGVKRRLDSLTLTSNATRTHANWREDTICS